jgi:hypothetical protein
LSNILPREFEFKTGSGTESLYIILKALGLSQQQKIVHTDSMCFSDSQAIRFAGLQSHYLDIDKKNLNPTKESYLEFSDQNSIVLGVHGYGYLRDFSSCNSENFIEDAALVFPERGNAVGSYGIASFLSFGSGKPFELGGGSVVATDDKAFYLEMKRVFSSLNRSHLIVVEDLSKKHTSMYNRGELKRFNDVLTKRSNEFLARSSFINDSSVFDYSRTREKKLIAQEKLINLVSQFNDLELLEPYSEHDFPWRFSFLCRKKSIRSNMLYKGIEEGLAISSWHPALSSYIEGTKSGENLNSNEIGERIINVDFSVDIKHFEDFLWRFKS